MANIKYTPERVAKICDAIAEGRNNEQAAQIGGISKETFYQWYNNKSDFLNA